MDERKALCRNVNLCILCLAVKNKTHSCVVQSCPRCFASHNILLCPQESEDNLLAAQENDGGNSEEEELLDSYSANQLGESINLIREYAKESRVLPTREINGDTESEEEETTDDYAANRLMK